MLELLIPEFILDGLERAWNRINGRTEEQEEIFNEALQREMTATGTAELIAEQSREPSITVNVLNLEPGVLQEAQHHGQTITAALDVVVEAGPAPSQVVANDIGVGR